MATGRRRPGRVRIIRMLILVLPALGAALLMVPAIALGWIQLSIGSAQPLSVSTSAGYAQSLYLSAATNSAITGPSPLGVDRKATSLVYVQEGKMADLCLVPRLRVPLVDLPVNLKITTDSVVNLGQITLAADGGALKAIELPATVVRFGEAPAGVPGAEDGRLGLQTVAEQAEEKGEDLDAGWMERVGLPTGPEEDEAPVTFENMAMESYGLVLDGGIVLRSLDIDLGLRELNC